MRGAVSLYVTLGEDNDPLEVQLVGAQLEIGRASATTLMSGRLVGAIVDNHFRTHVLPRVQNNLEDVIVSECLDSIPPDACCPEGSRAARLLDTFDTIDVDCAVSLEELQENDQVRAVTALDMDLDGDGEFDALSFGLQFRAVGATFDPDELPGIGAEQRRATQ